MEDISPSPRAHDADRGLPPTSGGAVTVGVHLPGDSAAEWVSALVERMPSETVADVDDIADPTTVEILVVGNPTGSELSRFDSVRFIQSTFAGPDRLSSDPERPNVPTARMTGGGMAVAMAEFVTTAVLASHRQLPAYRVQQRTQTWEARDQPTAASQTIGFLGYGLLAQAAAEMLAGLGFQVMAWARTARHDTVEVLSGAAGLSELLERSMVVVNLLPLTSETVGLLDAEAFGQFQPGASLVHCGRGPQVKVPDLIAALNSGQLSHAWLDVFDIEPLPMDSPLWQHPAVTITPHIAADSAPELVADDVVDNIIRFRMHGIPIGLI